MNCHHPRIFQPRHRANTGAAWSLFTGKQRRAGRRGARRVVALFLARTISCAPAHRPVRLGLIFGGIIGTSPTGCCRTATGRRGLPAFLSATPRQLCPLDFPAFNVATPPSATGSR